MPQVHTCSALTNTGIAELWKIIMEYVAFTKESGYFEKFRKEQSVIRMHDTIQEYLNNSFYNCIEVSTLVPEIEKELYEEKITSYRAAIKLLDRYFGRQTDL